jgi:hypothetical protein
VSLLTIGIRSLILNSPYTGIDDDQCKTWQGITDRSAGMAVLARLVNWATVADRQSGGAGKSRSGVIEAIAVNAYHTDNGMINKNL